MFKLMDKKIYIILRSNFFIILTVVISNVTISCASSNINFWRLLIRVYDELSYHQFSCQVGRDRPRPYLSSDLVVKLAETGHAPIYPVVF